MLAPLKPRPQSCFVRPALLLLVAVGALLAGPLAAQTELSGLMTEGVSIRGKGWSQLTDLYEIGQFLLGLLEVTVMTGLVAYHPVNTQGPGMRRARSQTRTLFGYALIGMVVGFLVMHHGAIIGFVIFGIGGLLRFRTDLDSTSGTMQLIIVTLIGLCVGLDLPVMALITTASTWAILYFFTDAGRFALDVKFADKSAPSAQIMTELETALKERGFTIVSMDKSKAKHAYTYVLVGTENQSREALVRSMADLQAKKTSIISDWHVA